MGKTALDLYVLDGGWAMLLLVPASMAALGITIRNLWVLRWSALERIAASLPTRDSGRGAAGESAEDVALRETVRMFAGLQPLSALFVLAPLAGLAGSLSALMALFHTLESGSQLTQAQLAEAFRRALVPATWGAGLSAFCYAWYAIFRARIANAEDELFRQPAETSPASGRPTGG